VEYQREGFDMFNAMMDGIKEESVGNLFNLQVEVQENPIVEEAAGPAGVAATSPPALGGAPAAPPVNGAGTQKNGTQKNQPPRNRGGQQAQAQGRRGRAGSGQPGGAHAAPAGAHAAPATGEAPAVVAPGLQQPKRPSRLQYSAPSADQPGQVEQRASASAASDQFSRVGRNDLCPCGSGRKYKRCHGDPRNRTEG
jgi:preprotein translocase subunit SecA